MPHVRFVDYASPRWIAEFVCAGRSTRGPSTVPSCAEAYGGSFTGAVCTAPVTQNKKEGWEGGTTAAPTVVVRKVVPAAFVEQKADALPTVQKVQMTVEVSQVQ